MRRLLAICLAVIVVSTGAHAGIEDGIAAYKRGDYGRALREFRALAEQGNSHAQFNLGLMYANAKGVASDNAEAVKWYANAAVRGHAAAQYNLGIMYAEGVVVPKNHAEAAKWYRMAAEQGHPAAQNRLGALYAQGQGGTQDYVSAHMWFSLAAARGNYSALKNRSVIERFMKPDQISEARRKARVWKPRK